MDIGYLTCSGRTKSRPTDLLTPPPPLRVCPLSLKEAHLTAGIPLRGALRGLASHAATTRGCVLSTQLSLALDARGSARDARPRLTRLPVDDMGGKGAAAGTEKKKTNGKVRRAGGTPAYAAANAVVTKKATVKLGLHPGAIADAVNGARALLDGMLMRHHDQLGGVLMSYSDDEIVGSDARIIAYAGYVDVHVSLRARVFCPAVGTKLLGVVNKVGVDFIGLLVHGVFNVSIAADQIREEFIHNPVDPTSPGGCWESAVDGGQHRIGVGSSVVFGVKAVSEFDDVLHLIGSLTEEGTGEAAYVGITEAQTVGAQTPKSAKKRKKERDGDGGEGEKTPKKDAGKVKAKGKGNVEGGEGDAAAAAKSAKKEKKRKDKDAETPVKEKKKDKKRDRDREGESGKKSAKKQKDK